MRINKQRFQNGFTVNTILIVKSLSTVDYYSIFILFTTVELDMLALFQTFQNTVIRGQISSN